MSEENKNPFEGLDRKQIEELIYKREIPNSPYGNVEKSIRGDMGEGYQPTRNIVGLPPGADVPDSNEED